MPNNSIRLQSVLPPEILECSSDAVGRNSSVHWTELSCKRQHLRRQHELDLVAL